MSCEGFDHSIRCTSLGQFGDRLMAQIVKTEAFECRGNLTLTALHGLLYSFRDQTAPCRPPTLAAVSSGPVDCVHTSETRNGQGRRTYLHLIVSSAE
jgi:hypothetical protein